MAGKGWSIPAINIQGTSRIDSGEGGTRAYYVTPDLSCDFCCRTEGENKCCSSDETKVGYTKALVAPYVLGGREY